MVNRKYIILSLALVIVLLLDQATKLSIASSYNLYESSAVIHGLFNITYIRNPGAAFGFLAGADPVFRSTFFIAVSVAAVVFIALVIRKVRQEETVAVLGLSLILGGALGNLIDRIRLGEVIDFLDVYVGSYHWPAFNMADSAISIGAFLLILEIIKKKSLFD
ncbi:MAG: signal peptidase II [Deltaproteobacteria bacterium]|nr:signal peptidase II [Deltaproteobacteria bacterium]MBN2687199.1 signal peptidase II [Deltaproteobacteria bacterium]